MTVDFTVMSVIRVKNSCKYNAPRLEIPIVPGCSNEPSRGNVNTEEETGQVRHGISNRSFEPDRRKSMPPGTGIYLTC